MLSLASETPAIWVDQISPHLDEILLDHAHCEKKAASTAIALLFRYPHIDGLLRPLSALAREELEHFEQVLDHLAARRVAFRRLTPSGYAAGLRVACRREEPANLLDTLLCCALIEARSCERMKLLSENLPDPALGAFYGALLASEARHFSAYHEIAEQVAPRAEVRARLTELARHEAEVLDAAPFEARLHGGVSR